MINKGLARLAASWPYLSDRLASAYEPLAFDEVPWAAAVKSLARSRVALVTTAGVHHRRQAPFDMNDANGDPSYRVLDAAAIEDDFTITHDYYDHRDAEKDLNVVFPITRLREMQAAGCVGAVAEQHFSFMGHIDGPHIGSLANNTAPQVAAVLKSDRVDAVLLTPA